LLNQYTNEWGEVKFNQWLSNLGFSSATAYLDFTVAEAFDNKTYNYDFSMDGLALFLDEVIPANEGSDELSGQTYNGIRWGIEDDYSIKDNGQIYAFTAFDYTYTNMEYSEDNHNGTYTYNSAQEMVWLKPYTADRQTQYDGLAGSPGYSSDSAAGIINYRLRIQ
jgi:hypothetical protein